MAFVGGDEHDRPASPLEWERGGGIQTNPNVRGRYMKRPRLRTPNPLARRASAIGVSLVMTLVGAVTALAADTLDPATVVKTLEAGQSTTVDKTFHLDALPANADIVFAIDTTGSMGGAITQAKNDAASIVTSVQAQIPNARFALADFKDYDGVIDKRT